MSDLIPLAIFAACLLGTLVLVGACDRLHPPAGTARPAQTGSTRTGATPREGGDR